jgi:hypothetical protein
MDSRELDYTAFGKTAGTTAAQDEMFDPSSRGSPAGSFSTNTHKKCERSLKKHPKVNFHFIPTRSSWLNQIETLVFHSPKSVVERSDPKPEGGHVTDAAGLDPISVVCSRNGSDARPPDRR